MRWYRNNPRLTGDDPLPFWMLQAASAYYSVLPEKFVAEAGEYLPGYVATDIIAALIPGSAEAWTSFGTVNEPPRQA